MSLLAQSNTDIANMALSHLGSGKEIADLDTERSDEARAMRRFYDTALKLTIRDGDFGFTRRVETLSLVTDNRPLTYPKEWLFEYRWPTSAVLVRKVLSGNRLDALDTAVPWEQSSDVSGSLILTDMEDAAVKYNVLVTAIERFDPDFVMCLSFLLAALAAPRLTNGDPLNLGTKCMQKYQGSLSVAMKNDSVQSSPDVELDADLVRARD